MTKIIKGSKNMCEKNTNQCKTGKTDIFPLLSKRIQSNDIKSYYHK